MKFSRPSGGAKSITLQMEPARNQSVTSSGPSFIPAQPSASPERFKSSTPERFKSPSPERFKSSHPPQNASSHPPQNAWSHPYLILDDSIGINMARPLRNILNQSSKRAQKKNLAAVCGPVGSSTHSQPFVAIHTTRRAQLVHLVYIDNLATFNLILL
jgi:hypothetical protein